MNILFIKDFFVGFMISEIPRVSVFGHCPYSANFHYFDNINSIYFNFVLIFVYFNNKCR